LLFKPNLILLDIMMPDLNGWQVLAKLRADKSFNRTRVLFVSVMKGDEYKKHKTQKNQYASSITKPFDNKVLISKVKALLK
ncbi:MAG: response regulator, partial [Candidatus Diapherotrites archaeon]|nr:response regulator [Candidatus Diapherotrites archaeon]